MMAGSIYVLAGQSTLIAEAFEPSRTLGLLLSTGKTRLLERPEEDLSASPWDSATPILVRVRATRPKMGSAMSAGTSPELLVPKAGSLHAIERLPLHLASVFFQSHRRKHLS